MSLDPAAATATAATAAAVSSAAADPQPLLHVALQRLGDSTPLKSLADRHHSLRALGSFLLAKTAAAPSTPPSLTDLAPTDPSIGDGTPVHWLWDWIARHKVLAGLLAAAFASGSLWYCHQVRLGTFPDPTAHFLPSTSRLRLRPKRLAHKASNGARCEVVVVAGSPAEPLAGAVARDLARRGFIVYWTTSSPEEDAVVAGERNEDIRALPVYGDDDEGPRESIRALSRELNVPVAAFPGAAPHLLSLAGIIVLPDLYYPPGPAECVSLAQWHDLLTSKLLGPIYLLTHRGGLLDLARSHAPRARVVLVAPTGLGSLNPGYNGGEAVACSGLAALAATLHHELGPQGVAFVHLRLGSFAGGLGGTSVSDAAAEKQVQAGVREAILGWPENLRGLYARPFQAMSALVLRVRFPPSHPYQSSWLGGLLSPLFGLVGLGGAAPPLRVLHYTLFDALTDRHPRRVYYAGKNAVLYGLLPKYLPEWVVAWWLHPPAPQMPLALEKGWEPL